MSKLCRICDASMNDKDIECSACGAAHRNPAKDGKLIAYALVGLMLLWLIFG